MEFKARPSSIGCFLIMESQGRKFVLDTSSISPRNYAWGVLKEEVSLDLYEINPNDLSLEIKFRKVSISSIAIMVQPISKFIYDLLKKSFDYFDVSQLIILKLALFATSMLISYLLFKYIMIDKAHQKAKVNLVKSRKYKLVLKTTGRRSYISYLFLALNVICFILFVSLNDGSEGVFLAINAMLAFPLYMSAWSMAPIYNDLQRGRVTFDRIEECKKEI